MDMTEEDMAKLVFFEHLFFLMDENSDGGVDAKYCRQRVQFIAVEHTETEIDESIESADKNGDGKITRLEFCKLCVAVLMG